MGRNRLKSTMYRHTIGHQHQVLRKPAASFAQGDAFPPPPLPWPGRTLDIPITSWPEPAAATAALQHPVPSTHPQTLAPPRPAPRQNPTRGISVSGRGAQGQGREAAVSHHHHHPPPLHPLPQGHTRPRTSPPSLPPGSARPCPPPLPRPTRR